ESLSKATYMRDRRAHLARANLGIGQLRFFFRLAVELHYLDRRRGTSMRPARSTRSDALSADGPRRTGWRARWLGMAKRDDHLFARIAEFGALHAAARRAILGKRRKPGAAAFFATSKTS